MQADSCIQPHVAQGSNIKGQERLKDLSGSSYSGQREVTIDRVEVEMEGGGKLGISFRGGARRVRERKTK